MQNLFAEARHRVPLITFIEQCFGKGNSHSGSARWDDCPACRRHRTNSGKLSVMGSTTHLFKCFACGASGDVAEFARHWYGLPDSPEGRKKAAEMLLGLATEWVRKPPVVKTRTPLAGEDKRDIKPFIKALLEHECEPDPSVFAYLARRGFSGDAIAWLWHNDLLRSLPENPEKSHELVMHLAGGSKQHLFDAGLAKLNRKGEIGYPAIAFKPLVFIFPGKDSAEFRSIHPLEKMRNGKFPPKVLRYGSALNPWVIKGSKKSKTTFITEGLMDAVSLRALQKAQGKEPSTVIAIPGVKSWQDHWNTFIRPNNRILIAFDGDEPGINAGNEMVKRLIETGIEGNRVQNIAHRLPSGKDINDLLVGK